MAFDAGPPRRETPPQPRTGRVRVTPWFSWLLLLCVFVCCMQLNHALEEERAANVLLQDVVRSLPTCRPRPPAPVQRVYPQSRDVEVDA